MKCTLIYDVGYGMKICKRVYDWLQVVNAEGDVRVCSWMHDNVIGNIIENDYRTLINGKKANEIFSTFEDGSFSKCDPDNCPYLSNGKVDEIYVEVDEWPEYPHTLLLGYEGNCNYKCTCCTSFLHMKDTRENDYAQQYDILEEKLKEMMPYIKEISANGRGELFASPHTMKLLNEWKPLAPKEEIKIALETNGSLFNEKNWKKIENLGKYYLRVVITVMSFDEMVYQHLSGTKLPISNIENNLHFVKKLRDEGIVNSFELATVLQEENFREMPEFTRRCIEEFGADKVRIRPIFPGGIYDKNIQWFMDVRNPYHPYYEQYCEIMKNPIFKNPKVLLWSGELASDRGPGPLEDAKQLKIMNIVNQLLENDELYQYIATAVGGKSDRMYLYGFSAIAKTLVILNESERLLNIDAIIDKNVKREKYRKLDFHTLEDSVLDKGKTVLVTVYNQYQQIEEELRSRGFTGDIVNIYNLVCKFNNPKSK